MKVLLLFIFLKITLEHCGFTPNKIKHRLVEPNNLRRLQSRTPFQPIRIYFDYTTLDSQIDISYETKDNIKKILSITKLVYERLLLVQRFSFSLKIPVCDDRVLISSTVSSIGINADLVIFPFVDNTPSGNTQAYASGCVLAATNNRPVAGIIGFTKNLDSLVGNWMEYFVSLAIHEIGHVLVFNPSIFDLFIDEEWNTIPISEVVTTKVINNVERQLIITPKVLEAARRHFNCSDLIGVELENQGGSGTAGSHWEARVMLSDLMIGVAYDEAVLSEITLALFEDSGWYKTNKYTGGLFRYGKNEGCGFLNQRCSINGTSDYPNEFCNNGPYSSVCTAGYLSRAICYITEMESQIDVNYRYFTNSRLGGYRLADYCPVAAVPTNTTNYYPYSCSSGLSQFPADMNEVISRDSICFLSTLIKQDKFNDYKDKYGKKDNAICYTYDCDYINQRLQVLIGNSFAICPQQGGYVVVPGYVGTLLCPRYDRVCTGISKCNNMIDCVIDKVLSNNTTLAVISNTTNVTNTNTTDTLTNNTKVTNNTNPTNTTTPINTPTNSPIIPNIKPNTTTQTNNPNNTVIVNIESFLIKLNILPVFILIIIFYYCKN
jgi:leishmanolysin